MKPYRYLLVIFFVLSVVLKINAQRHLALSGFVFDSLLFVKNYEKDSTIINSRVLINYYKPSDVDRGYKSYFDTLEQCIEYPIVTVFSKNGILSYQCDENGYFDIGLDSANTFYTFVFSKQGYESKSIIIDTRKVMVGMNLNFLLFIKLKRKEEIFDYKQQYLKPSGKVAHEPYKKYINYQVVPLTDEDKTGKIPQDCEEEK